MPKFTCHEVSPEKEQEIRKFVHEAADNRGVPVVIKLSTDNRTILNEYLQQRGENLASLLRRLLLSHLEENGQ